MEKNLPEHEAFGVLRAFSVSAFEDLPDPLVYSLADAGQDFQMQEPADWKEGMQKHLNKDEINLQIVDMNQSDSEESESFCMVTSNGDVSSAEEEVEGVAASGANDEKMVIEDAELEDKEEPEEHTQPEEQTEEPRSLKQRVLRFIAEIGSEGMQNLVAVGHSLISEGASVADALRTAFETSEVAANHPFSADLLAVVEAYQHRFQMWVPMIAQFNIDHVIALIPNIVDTISRSMEGQERVELDLAPIFQMCNPAMMGHLQRLIPQGEERVFEANPADPLSVIDDAEEAVEEEFGAVIHHGVICDACEMNPIRGVRYKSTLRSNYDLCENCEPLHDKNDPLIKFKMPIQELDTLPGATEFSRSVGNRGRHGGLRGRRGRGCRFGGRPGRGRRGGCRFGGRPGRGPFGFLHKMQCPFQAQQHENVDVDRRDPTKEAYRCDKEQMCKEMKQKFREWKAMKKDCKRWKKECKKERKQDVKQAKKEYKEDVKKAKKEWKQAKKQWKQENRERKQEVKQAKQEWKQAKNAWKAEKKAEKKKKTLDADVVGHLDMEEVSVQKPGATALKTWKVKNTGTEAWPEGSSAVFVHGNKSLLVEGFEQCLVACVEPNDIAYIRVMFQAPELPGKYFVKYRMASKSQKFGGKMVQTIIVEEPEEAEVEEPAEQVLDLDHQRPRMNRAETTDTILTAVTESSEPGDIPNFIEDLADDLEFKPSAPEKERQHAEQIAQLKAMGFTQDDETLESVLVAAKGDVAQAISMLM